MAALEPVKASVNVLQGLSARMCTGSHGARFGALGAYRVGEHDPAPAETLRQLPRSPFPRKPIGDGWRRSNQKSRMPTTTNNVRS